MPWRLLETRFLIPSASHLMNNTNNPSQQQTRLTLEIQLYIIDFQAIRIPVKALSAQLTHT
jgi:hypothetical protein